MQRRGWPPMWKSSPPGALSKGPVGGILARFFRQSWILRLKLSTKLLSHPDLSSPYMEQVNRAKR